MLRVGGTARAKALGQTRQGLPPSWRLLRVQEALEVQSQRVKQLSSCPKGHLTERPRGEATATMKSRGAARAADSGGGVGVAGPGQVMAVTGHGEFGRRAAEPASAEHACQLSAQLACPACPAGGPSHGSTLHTGQLRPTAPSVDRGVDLPQRPDAPQCGEGQRLCPDDPGRLSGCLTVTLPTIVLVWAAWRPRMTTGCRRVRGRELGEAVCPPLGRRPACAAEAVLARRVPPEPLTARPG